MKKTFIVIAMSPEGIGLSGGDRIFIEFFKRISKLNYKVRICAWEKSEALAKDQGLNDAIYENWYLYLFKNQPFAISFLLRLIYGVYYAITYKIVESDKIFIYSASDFWIDSIPAFILKLRIKDSVLISSYYIQTPNPFTGWIENSKKIKFPSLKLIIYFLMQYPIKLLINKLSDFVCVTSDPDRYIFSSKGFKNSKIITITGGVDFNKYNDIPDYSQTYDGIYYGRFHYQKGVLELIDIWKLLTDKIPSAKLVMIGDGPLLNEVKEKILKLNLVNNIFLMGILLDGPEKYKLFKSSKVVLHPANYDSGGMAAAEIMYFYKPAVGFKLKALETYYAKGMLKADCFNNNMFAELIYNLLTDNTLYNKVSHDAHNHVINFFNWDTKVGKFIKTIDSEL